MFPKVPQSSLGILRVPQLPPPLEHPSSPLRILEIRIRATELHQICFQFSFGKTSPEPSKTHHDPTP